MDDCVVLMGHGTRDPEGASQFVAIVDAVRDEAPDRLIAAGFLEFGGDALPFIRDVVDRCVERGARHIDAVPILLHDAGHTNRDMPAEVAAALVRHPALDITLTGPLGITDALLEIIEDRIADVDSSLPGRSTDETAILLIGRGTTNAGANGDFFKIGRLLWERNRFGLVECAFVSLTTPSVPDGIDRCARLGAGRVLVIPYFIHTGVLVKRIAVQVDEARARYPELDLAVGQPMGAHPNLVSLIAHQFRGEPVAAR